MASEIDIFLAEKKTGTLFSNRMKSNLLSSIRQKTNKGNTGLALKSTVKAFYKNNYLDRLTIFTPYYIYPILDVGFEGSKKKGVNYRLKARNFMADVIENGKLAEDLADMIGDQRGSSILSRVAFGFDKNLKSSNSL